MVFGKRLFAATYDRVNERWERKLDPIRQRTLAPARGRVLELGGGTGRNLPLYGDDVELTVVEPNPHMAERLVERARAIGRQVTVVPDRAEALSFQDGSFEFLVSTLMLCSVEDLDASIREARRVLAPGSTWIFLEHTNAGGWKGRAQTLVNPVWGLFSGGCNIDRDILGAFERAGFARLDLLERFHAPVGPSLANPHLIAHAVR